MKKRQIALGMAAVLMAWLLAEVLRKRRLPERLKRQQRLQRRARKMPMLKERLMKALRQTLSFSLILSENGETAHPLTDYSRTSTRSIRTSM